MFGGKEKKERFEVIYKEGSMAGFKVVVDKETGVNYLCSWDGYSGGITPLLNSDGSVVVSPVSKE